MSPSTSATRMDWVFHSINNQPKHRTYVNDSGRPLLNIQPERGHTLQYNLPKAGQYFNSKSTLTRIAKLLIIKLASVDQHRLDESVTDFCMTCRVKLLKLSAAGSSFSFAKILSIISCLSTALSLIFCDFEQLTPLLVWRFSNL